MSAISACGLIAPGSVLGPSWNSAASFGRRSLRPMPGSIAEFIWSQVPDAELIGLECGPNSARLFMRCVPKACPSW
jgi:hypothetical protein